MAEFQIAGSGIIDLRSTKFTGFDGLHFATSGDATAQVNWLQFLGPPQLKTVSGNIAHADTLEIFAFGDTDFSLIGISTWSADDRVIIHDTFGDNQITGTGFNDIITISAGKDIAKGGVGEDTLVVDYSAASDDISASGVFFLFNTKQPTSLQQTGFEHFNVETGSGNDSFGLGAGADTAIGGAGNDTIDSRTGDASIDGGAGRDSWLADLSAETGAITINLQKAGIGAIGGGNFIGGIEALGNITTGGGDDSILTLVGARAAGLSDFIFTGFGDDTVRVGGGNDVTRGGAGEDLLIVDYSSATVDLIATGVYFLTAAKDSISVQQGEYEHFNVKTGSGNDNFALGGDSDTAASGAGNDTINSRGGDANIDGGAGNDSWSADLSAETKAINIDLDKVGINAIGGGSFIGGIEALGNITTGGGDDSILTLVGAQGTGLSDFIFAGGGDDTVRVGGGTDLARGGDDEDLLIADYATANVDLIATGVFFLTASKAAISLQQAEFEHFDVKTGSGNDSFPLGGGADTAASGAGNDKIDSRGGDASIDGGAGKDSWTADLSAETEAIKIDLQKAGVNAIGGGSFVGGIEALGSITTGGGDDAILTLVGARGAGLADIVFAGGGSDTVRVGGGNDLARGGGGEDLLIVDYSAASDDIGASGVFFLFNTKQPTSLQQAEFEHFNVKTGSGNDSFSLGADADTASGGAGNDSIAANGGKDIVAGNDGADTLLGGDGDDLLIGGAGRDLLTGGAGKDRFDYNATAESVATAGGRDQLFDFDANAQDRIDLSTIDANADGGTANDKFVFMGTAAINGLGQVRVQQVDLAGTADDITVLLINTTGTTAADMQIALKGLITLDGADFLL